MSDMQFKVTLRGYEREAVDSHIVKLQSDAKRDADELGSKIDALSKEKELLTQKLQDSEKLCTEMQVAMSSAQEFINAQAAKMKIAERELDDARKKNALYLDKQDALTKLLADAQVKCSKLVEQAEEHSRHIIAEAEKEKSEILDKAQQSAAHIIGESKKDADAVQTALRDRFSTITDTVAAIRQLTAQVGACCDAADQMIAEPDSFFYSEQPEWEPATV